MTTVRPYLVLSAALALGEALGLSAGGAAALWPLAALACAAVILLGAGFSVRGWPAVATALLGLAVAASAEEVRRGVLESASLANGLLAVDVKVGAGAEPGSFPAEFAGVPLRVSVAREILDGAPPPRPGERWRVSGWLERKPLSDRSRRVLWVVGRAASARRLAAPSAPDRVLARARREASRRIGIGLGRAPEIAQLHRALLLGERGCLSPKLRQAFADAGTIHVFAVSGLHVGTVALTVFALLVLCGVPLRWTGLFVVPAVWGYALLIGAPTSAVRAAAMASLAALGPVFLRRADLLVSWALVFLAVHLAHPAALADVGSLLSFTVMLAIAVWARFFGRGVTFAAWAAGVPIVAHVFGVFTPAGLFANLLLLPAAGVTVAAGTLGVLASFVSEALAAHVNGAAALFTRLMAGLSETVASVPGASVEIVPWTRGQCAAWYLALALAVGLAVHVRERRRKRI